MTRLAFPPKENDLQDAAKPLRGRSPGIAPRAQASQRCSRSRFSVAGRTALPALALTASGVRNRIPNVRERVAVRRVYFCRDRAVPPNAGAWFVSRLVGGAPGEKHRHETRKQQCSHVSTPFLQRLSVVTRHILEVARRVVRRRGLPEAGLKHGSLPKPRAEKAQPVLTTATELKMGVAQHARARCPAWLAVLELLSHHMSHELRREPRVRSHAGVPLVILPQ